MSGLITFDLDFELFDDIEKSTWRVEPLVL